MDPQGHKPADQALALRGAPDALRVQVAAVAAQQVALDEEEMRLAQRQDMVERQEEELATQVEEKRRQLLLLGDRVRADRAQLQQERTAHARHIAQLKETLTPAQRGLLEAEQRVQAERQRLARLQQRLRQRWHEHWKRKQHEYLERQRRQVLVADSLTERDARLQAAESSLRDQRLRLNGDSELTRRHVKEAWGKLRQAQFRWKHRRGLERAALRVRSHALEATAQQLAQARGQLDQDQRAWREQRQALELELDGVNERVHNQRQLLNKQEAQLRWLEEQVHAKEQQLAALAPGEPGSAAFAPPALVLPAKVARPLALPVPGDAQRVVDLDRVADDLGDQRRQMVETWQRLTAVHAHWHAERAQALAEIETLGGELHERELHVQAREAAGGQADAALHQRYQELTLVEQQIIAWRARLRTEENSWEGDKTRLGAELRAKQVLAERDRAALVELRKRWGARRRQEIEELNSERGTLEIFRKDIAKLRQKLVEQAGALEDEQRLLSERTLALEHYRLDVLHQADNPQVKRRLERLRRRWLAQNADALRRAHHEREVLRAELANLEQRHERTQRRAAEVSAAEAQLTETQTAWEQRQLLAEAVHERLEQERRHAEAHRLAAERQVAVLRDEVEQMVRALLDQPDPPRLHLERAA